MVRVKEKWSKNGPFCLFVCVAQCQHFPKNGVKLSGKFRFIFLLSHHVAACSQSVTFFFPHECKHGLFSVSYVREVNMILRRALRETQNSRGKLSTSSWPCTWLLR